VELVGHLDPEWRRVELEPTEVDRAADLEVAEDGSEVQLTRDVRRFEQLVGRIPVKLDVREVDRSAGLLRSLSITTSANSSTSTTISASFDVSPLGSMSTPVPITRAAIAQR
jgi:hypothetical protein